MPDFIQSQALTDDSALSVQPFHVTATLTSAAAATAVNLLPAASVRADKKVYVTGFTAFVNGATDWATTATVKIQDTHTTPVDFITLDATALDGNEIHHLGSDSVTVEAAVKSGTGGTADKGLQVKGDANGTGSNLIVTVWGFIK